MDYTISFTNKPSLEEIDALCNGLEKHAKKIIGRTSFHPFGYLVHDDEERLIAGCTGVIMYGFLHIKLLWVEEGARNKGLGKQLMEKAESYAKESNCQYIILETFDFQAKHFYEKLGYTITLVYEGFENDIQFYYFRKKIN
ncbi:MAG: GNAT family N-acetyltransferase [Gammaproteobacteria bacterium]|nr:GNAT family N-acetyltransferase [Gammaproteobacteria bacterium]